jgi:hypothetical protein
VPALGYKVLRPYCKLYVSLFLFPLIPLQMFVL